MAIASLIVGYVIFVVTVVISVAVVVYLVSSVHDAIDSTQWENFG